MELEGVTKLVSILLFFPMAACYTLGYNILGRCFLAFLLMLMTFGVASDSGGVAAAGALVAFLLIPLAIAPFFYLLQVVILRRVENQYGGTGQRLRVEWLGIYRVL